MSQQIQIAGLEAIRCKYSLADVLTWLDRARRVSATVIGETITDKYIYVHPLFKTGKDNIVAFEPVGEESWAGGASIVAEDLSQFAAEVRLINNGPPVHKLRYVDEAFKQKLFSVVTIPSIRPPDAFDISNILRGLVVVADYGHGLIDTSTARIIASKHLPMFLAITVQSNSANWGFNTLIKWPRADYVVVDRNELQLACADRTSPIEILAPRMGCLMHTQYLAVTLGHEGCLISSDNQIVILPAVSDKVIDRMGAGDAFLAATASLAWAGAPPEIIALVGNVAGAIKVGKLGNQSITREEVTTWLTRILS